MVELWPAILRVVADNDPPNPVVTERPKVRLEGDAGAPQEPGLRIPQLAIVDQEGPERSKTVQVRQRAPDCGFADLGCRTDPLANGLGLSFGVGQWAWDTGAGVVDLGIYVVDDALCEVNPFCGPARAREEMLAALAYSEQLARDWQDPGAALSAWFSEQAAGIERFRDRVRNSRSGFEASREIGYAGATVTSVILPAAGLVRGLRIARAGMASADTIAEGSRLIPYSGLTTPRISSPGRLANIVNNLCKGTANPRRTGYGTTMDAIRNELATGRPTMGRWHLKAGRDAARGLEKWLLENQPTGALSRYSDRLIAQSLLDELMDLLR